MMGSGGGMGFGGEFMWVFWLLLIVFFAVIVKAMIGGPSGPDKSGEDTPKVILKQRYARGEIDEQEFERRLRELEK
jgi:putative membrane protein